VHFINDENFVPAVLGLKAHLFGEGSDVFDGIVGSSIEFDDVEGCAFVEGSTGGALVAGFEVFGALFAVQYFSQDTGTGGFADTARAGEKECVRHVVCGEGIFQGAGHVLLAYDIFEALGAIFSGRNNEVAHGC
jgi:hypothetical protein